MHRSVIHLAFTLLLGAACHPALYAQVLPPEAQLAADAWMRKDCSVGEQDQLAPVLNQFKPQFEMFFLNALNQPLPDPLRAEVQAAASEQFDLRQEALKTGAGLGLSPADLEALRKMSRQDYLAREIASFELSYKSRAIAGLAVVAGEAGIAALRALVADPASRLRGSARQALAHLQVPPAE